jgi:hypothetical protein
VPIERQIAWFCAWLPDPKSWTPAALAPLVRGQLLPTVKVSPAGELCGGAPRPALPSAL